MPKNYTIEDNQSLGGFQWNRKSELSDRFKLLPLHKNKISNKRKINRGESYGGGVKTRIESVVDRALKIARDKRIKDSKYDSDDDNMSSSSGASSLSNSSNLTSLSSSNNLTSLLDSKSLSLSSNKSLSLSGNNLTSLPMETLQIKQILERLTNNKFKSKYPTNEQLHFIKCALEKKNIFLTGAPFTGKKYAIELLTSVLTELSVKFVVTSKRADTAILLNGLTLDSWLGIPSVHMEMKKILKSTKKNAKKWQDLDVLIIDGISACVDDYLSVIYELSRYYRSDIFVNNSSSITTNGLCIIVCGDFMEDYPLACSKFEYNTFESKTWKQLCFERVILNKIFSIDYGIRIVKDSMSDVRDNVKDGKDIRDNMGVLSDIKSDIKSDNKDIVSNVKDFKDGSKISIDLKDGSNANIDLKDGNKINIDLKDGSNANVDLKDDNKINIDLKNDKENNCLVNDYKVSRDLNGDKSNSDLKDGKASGDVKGDKSNSDLKGDKSNSDIKGDKSSSDDLKDKIDDKLVEFHNLLNRIRTGKTTQEDKDYMSMLVRPRKLPTPLLDIQRINFAGQELTCKLEPYHIEVSPELLKVEDDNDVISKKIQPIITSYNSFKAKEFINNMPADGDDKVHPFFKTQRENLARENIVLCPGSQVILLVDLEVMLDEHGNVLDIDRDAKTSASNRDVKINIGNKDVKVGNKDVKIDNDQKFNKYINIDKDNKDVKVDNKDVKAETKTNIDKDVKVDNRDVKVDNKDVKIETDNKDIKVDNKNNTTKGITDKDIKNTTKIIIPRGTLGIVRGFQSDKNLQSNPLPKVDFGGLIVVIRPHKWERIEQQKGGQIILSYVQIPLLIAWAVSLHNACNLQFEAMYLRTKFIKDGRQFYKALCRVKNPDKLSLESFDESFFDIPDSIVDYYNNNLTNESLTRSLAPSIGESSSQSITQSSISQSETKASSESVPSSISQSSISQSSISQSSISIASALSLIPHSSFSPKLSDA